MGTDNCSLVLIAGIPKTIGKTMFKFHMSFSGMINKLASKPTRIRLTLNSDLSIARIPYHKTASGTSEKSD
jgi:hypothetical protein